MDDDGAGELRQLQGLRLLRAFLRIADAKERAMVIALAERLADGAPSGAVSLRFDGPSGEAPLTT